MGLTLVMFTTYSHYVRHLLTINFTRKTVIYDPNGLPYDMGLKQSEYRQWLAVVRKFCRMIPMDDALITKHIFYGFMAQLANSSS